MSEPPSIDTAQLNDPIASQTEWGPLKSGGTNIKTHYLKEIHAQRMEFRCSIGMMLFGGVFFLAGVGIMAAGINGFIKSSPEHEWVEFIGTFLFGLLLGGIGFFMLRSAMTPRVFDIEHGYYCRSRKKPEHTSDHTNIRDYVRLSEIHAIQLISEYVSGKKNSRGYYSYELNLILKDSSRIHIIDHAGRGAMIKDAEKLSLFLGKPLWSRI